MNYNRNCSLNDTDSKYSDIEWFDIGTIELTVDELFYEQSRSISLFNTRLSITLALSIK